MDVATHLGHLADEGSLLAVAADRAGPEAPVPTCPEWVVRDLVRHTGGVHRWATGIVSDLYLALWSRRNMDGMRVSGDPATLAHFSDNVHIRW